VTSLLLIAFTKITPRPETLMLYFSAGSGKETRLQRQRTEGLVLTPITSQGKLRLAPGVLFSILRYLQGAINKLFPETEWDMKGTECWSHRKILRWKVCLKCVAPRILRCQGFTIIPGSTNCGPRVLHTPPQREKFTSSWMIRTHCAIIVYCRPIPLLLL